MNAFALRQRALSRRTFLLASGVALGLPLLDAMTPACLANPAPPPPRRMVAICTNLGIIPHYFFPTTPGPNYESTPYLELLKEHRRDMTVLSGVSFPDVDGGHSAENCFLTAASHPTRGGFKNTISLDQFAADKLGQQTRFPTLNLHAGVEPVGRMGASLSWTAGGVIIPGERKPSRAFARMFLRGDTAEVDQQVAKLRLGRSILDSVGDRAKALARELGSADREKLDQYLTSVRDLEERLRVAQEWEYKPKPQVSAAPPKDVDDPAELLKQSQLHNQIAKLALETDSTRIVTIFIYQAAGKQNYPGVTLATHGLTHQIGSENRRQELRLLEEAQFRVFAELLTSLKQTAEQGGSLLDHTMVVYGTNFGNAGLHTTTNLPTIFAGGPFKHGQHLAFDTKRNYPLTNLYVSMLQALGVETDRFASGTSTMRGLERVS